MQVPVEIAFKNVEQSDAVEALVRERVAKLGKYFRQIISCRVAIEAPHRAPNESVREFNVRVDMSVPGNELVVSRNPGDNRTHQDVYLAIRDAFNAAERQLKDYSSKLRENRKPRVAPPHAVVIRIFHDEGYGFLMAPDGHEVYFHRNSVLNDHFDDLQPGVEVRFNEEEGLEGPQASTVETVGRHGKHEFTELR
ncbi:MAG: ribosome hibernation-promoting factor, HPF/YfiA family [Bradymonadaceae bacterium]